MQSGILVTCNIFVITLIIPRTISQLVFEQTHVFLQLLYVFLSQKLITADFLTGIKKIEVNRGESARILILSGHLLTISYM